MTFAFEALRRAPDLEAPNLVAVDAAERLILDEASDLIAASGSGAVVVVGEGYGALSLGAIALHGATDVRTSQDSLSGEIATQRNAKALGMSERPRALPLGPELFAGAELVLLRLPRSLAALDEIAALIAGHASPDVRVVAGGMVKHMTISMNEVLGRHFGAVEASLARQKARVLRASDPRIDPAAVTWPVKEFHPEEDLWVAAHGAAFAGSTIDIGTRLLLAHLDDASPTALTAIDLGCGTGVLAAAIAKGRPGITVIASDRSQAAVDSAIATMKLNGVADRVTVVRDLGLREQADASADLIMLNPPFHLDAAVHTGAALALFEDAARVLRPGGELLTVFNTHLGYGPALTRIIGTTRPIAKNGKFTVTRSVR